MRLKLTVDLRLSFSDFGVSCRLEKVRSYFDLNPDEAFDVLNRSGFFGCDASADWERNKLVKLDGGLSNKT